MNNKEKIIKVAKVSKIISMVLYIAAAVVCLGALIVAIVIPLTNAVDNTTEICSIFSSLACGSFLAVGLLWNTSKLFEVMEVNQTPFHNRVCHYMRKSSIFVIVMSIIPQVTGTAVSRILDQSSEMVFSVSVGGIICGVVLLLVSLCFNYGVELQNNENQTL